MRSIARLFVLALLFAPSVAHAQFSQVLRIKFGPAATLAQPARPNLWLDGGGTTCVDSPAQLATHCTIAAGAGGTLQTSYDNSGANPTITVTAGGGGVFVRDNAAPIGAPLFGVQSSGGGTSFFAVGAAGVSSYNGETTAGVGLPYIESTAGLDVASVGGGPQNTVIASYTPPNPTGGVYRVSIVASCSVNDTITITLSYTEAVDAFAQTLTPINAFGCTANTVTDTASATVLVRANASSAVSAQITNSGQVTSKASATIERLQ